MAIVLNMQYGEKHSDSETPRKSFSIELSSPHHV